MKGDFKMKAKFLVIFLTGLLLGALLGSIIFGQVKAQTYRTELYYLKMILSSLGDIESYVSGIPNIESYVSSIEGEVSDIGGYVEQIYYK